MRRFGIVWFILTLLLVGCQQSQEKSLKVTDVWSRPGLAGGNGAMYFMVENSTDQNDTLLKAESDAAETVELHKSSMDAEGNMSMQPQEKVDIPTGKTEFKPGGLHVMLINLKSELKAGQKTNLTLVFEKAGSIRFEVVVREP